MVSNYPPGAEFDASAPWNEREVPEKEFEVVCSQSLSKTVKVLTNNYTPGASGVEHEPDGDGHYSSIGYQDPDDTSDTCWAEEYHNNDYHTPKQLIELFGVFLETQKENGSFFMSKNYTNWLIEECKGWSEDETDYEEN